MLFMSLSIPVFKNLITEMTKITMATSMNGNVVFYHNSKVISNMLVKRIAIFISLKNKT